MLTVPTVISTPTEAVVAWATARLKCTSSGVDANPCANVVVVVLVSPVSVQLL
jgi:hypothetical protein